MLETFLEFSGDFPLGVEARFSTAKDMSSIIPVAHYFIFQGENLWKIPGMSSGIEECKILAGARDFHD
jgi:hypothetical protein